MQNSIARCERKKLCGVFVFCVVTAIVASAQTSVVLHNFTTTDAPSAVLSPATSLVEGFDGKFYGLTSDSFFKIGRYGEYTVEHAFCASPPSCFGVGNGFLVLGQYGDFLGAGTNLGPAFAGAAFTMTPGGSQKTLYDFCLNNTCPGGEYPFVSFQASDLSVYGATIASGAHDAGVVFKVSGHYFSILYRFCALVDCADGGRPTSLIEGTDGNLYGTTLEGGSHNLGPTRSGSVFKLTPSGVLTTLYSFCALSNCADGNNPSTLIQGADGNFYGTTLFTEYAPHPTLFRLTPEGVLTTLFSFCSSAGCAGGLPEALIQGSDGNLYVLNNSGGAFGADGTVLRVTLDGTGTVIHSFDPSQDGSFPSALTQGTDGAFYGMTTEGGAHRHGTIFRLDAGLGPFVKTVLTSGSVGSRVTIIGNNLTGATAVNFNGTPATFKACSNGTEIITNVPAGATSGPVTVALPTGTLTSNVPFTVRP
jgi:uncharacterized repeat protein (TIGR03803 family)